MSPDDILTCKQAAAELGISESRIYALIRDGRLVATRHGLRAFSIRRAALDPVRVRQGKRGPKPRLG